MYVYAIICVHVYTCIWFLFISWKPHYQAKTRLVTAPKPTLEWGVAVTTEAYGEGLVVTREP